MPQGNGQFTTATSIDFYYHNVDRNWARNESSSQPQGATGSTMERWQAESFRNQPYHGVQAVKINGKRDKGVVLVQNRGSSVGYIDPMEKKA